jgi:putative membrane protein
MKAIHLTAAALLVGLPLAGTPAAAQSIGEQTGVNSVLGISPSTHDFVMQVAVSDMFEIQSSQLAVQRSDGPTKAFAEQMVKDHTKTSDELKALIAADTVKETPPTVLDSTHQKKLDALGKLKGGDFTKQYHSDQVNAHEDAVSLFERYAKSGENAALKDWAGKTLPALQHHLEMAKQLAD